jgi:hypothetical protein
MSIIVFVLFSRRHEIGASGVGGGADLVADTTDRPGSSDGCIALRIVRKIAFLDARGLLDHLDLFAGGDVIGDAAPRL